jgi:lipopolysaccharide/colanic/teichoic acid biosynthesis glycosyltransferase
MLLSPHGGVEILWQFACSILGGVVATRSWGLRAEGRGQAGLREVREKRRARRPSSRRARGAPASPYRTQAVAHPTGKRIVDVALGVICLIAALPLIAAIALGIAVTLGRPILFSQQRVGRGGRLFRLYKFRTLDRRPLARSDIEWCAPAAHPFALLLRQTGLDELPQLINVLRGEMSLVGPRPERPHFVQQFRNRFPGYTSRHCLPPGITGWAQVNRFRGDTSIARRLEHDLHYLNHWSLGFDLWILLLTLGGIAANIRAFARGGDSGQRIEAV